MVIDRHDPELAEMVLGRNTNIVSIDMSSALRLRKFETQVRMVSARFKSILGIFMIPFVYRNDKQYSFYFFHILSMIRPPEQLLLGFLLNCVFNCHGCWPFTVKSKLNGTLLRTIHIPY